MSSSKQFSMAPEDERASRARSSRSAENRPIKADGPTAAIQQLQRSLGNRAVGQLLRQGGHPAIARREDAALIGRLVQRDAAPTQLDEEDPTAAQPRHEGLGPIARMVQRDAAPTQLDEEDPTAAQARHEGLGPIARMVQRDAAPVQEDDPAVAQAKPEVGLQGGPVSSAIAQQIGQARGSGAPLDHGLRGQMEGAFGVGLGDVRVHTDTNADAINRRISAVAFTTGSDIFFTGGSYNPQSKEGKALLAHELTHVVQQRDMSPSGPLTVGPAGDSYEQEADATGAAVAEAISQDSAPAAP